MARLQLRIFPECRSFVPYLQAGPNFPDASRARGLISAVRGGAAGYGTALLPVLIATLISGCQTNHNRIQRMSRMGRVSSGDRERTYLQVSSARP